VEGETIIMQELCEFVRTGNSPEGKVLGTFRPTGIRSHYADKIEANGIRFDPRWFTDQQH